MIEHALIPGEEFNPYRLFYGSYIPNALLRYKDISSTAKLCYARLVQYAGKDGKAFPSQKKLAEEIGVSRRQVNTVLKQLEADGFIKRDVPEGNDKWTHKTTNYIFLFHPVFLYDYIRVKQTSLSDVKKTSHGDLSGFPDDNVYNIWNKQAFKRGERGNYDNPEALKAK
jgi:DNA-binding transcriptional MocR family regulator